jgi:hypothetical protein
MTDSLPAAPEPDRDAKIEQLLLGGLDHYFASELEQAINVWTRALFLDRNHARARAYIDRARSALAERQRESEELLQNGLAAFRRGEGDEARRLLDAAISRGAPREEALAVLERLSRLEQGGAPRASVEPRVLQPPPSERSNRASRRRRALVLAAGAIVGIGAIGVLLLAAPWDWRSVFPADPEPAATQAPPVPATFESRLPIPLRGETALGRARSLAASGRLHDALAALEAVKPTDPQRAEADSLRAAIQRQLLSLAGIPAGSRKGAGALP